MKKGKALEQLVVAIQEYIKNSPDTLVVPNAKLIDNCGLEREIDVFVQAKVQGGKIGIAFECKDYNDKVDVKEIEAFHSKSTDIPGIHKRILVSSNGFTSGAKTKAKFYGIELYQIGEVPLDEILNPFDIYYTQCWVEMDRYYRVIVEDNNDPALYSDNGVFYCADDKEVEMPDYIVCVLQKCMPSMLPSIHNYLHSQGKKRGNIPLTITPPTKMYVLDIHGDRHIVKELQVSIRVTLNEQLQEIAKQSILMGNTEEVPIVRISEYTRDDGINLVLVHGNDNTYNAFLRDSNGNLKGTNLVHLNKPTI